MKVYESIPRLSLIPKIPVMLRMDGKAFSTLTRSLEKPYCRPFQECMWAAAIHLCKNIQGARMAYVQSDEISVLVTDYQSDQSEGWFGYNLQKMTSVAASLATGAFNKEYHRRFPESTAIPAFDARAWSCPAHEVVNVMIWRQQDAVRNSISSLAQSNFSPKQLHGVSSAGMQDMLFKEKQINWNDCPDEQKRGVAVIKVDSTKMAIDRSTMKEVQVVRSEWVVDSNIPAFTQDRTYVQKLVDHVANVAD